MRSLYRYLTLAIAFFAIQGCKDDFLDRPPLDQLTDANFYRTEPELLAATAPLYNIVWFDYNDKAALAFGDARGGIMQSNDRQAFYQFSVPATDVNTLLPAYKSFYKIIGQSNITIDNVNRYATNVPDAAKRRAIAEARFMRGLAYYYLVMNWGAVPIIYDNTTQMADRNIRRNTPESVWQFIIRDLKYAAENLGPAPVQQGRLTKWSAEGMLARMYLTRSGLGRSLGNRNQSDLDSAKLLAGSVIKNSPHELLPTYVDLFVSANNNSSNNNKESLFALQWMPIREPWGINNSFQAYMAFNPSVTGTGDGWGAAQGASANMVKYFQDNPRDSIRRKATFMFDQDVYPELNRKAGGTKFTATNISNIKKYIIGTPEDNGGKGGFMTAFINTYMLRLAEVYLIYAEAILGNAASTSDSEALKYYNAVRKRAGMPEKTTITFMDIFQEKRVETAMEGTAWYDIVRWSYFDMPGALKYIAEQDKGTYTVTYVPNSNPRSYNFTYTSEFYPATAETMMLPLPEAEKVNAPSLLLDPVPFDFSKLKD
ncbi:RagB/SusD family nutrient uptake outer membrane protein [Pedobacter sp. SYSU D00535]|uniref:RagB/SusD family nutrient uptake outer membrane protein n=1 Tax=Pedobacter sp. SYSU D00535 TaxID=2810308 RepID=UPI001A96DC01|nr:RagB/SusD family nutrient uptake outer membrane protein [Pedobacter sp. SYSU D00535]